MSPVYQCLRQWRRRLWWRSWVQGMVWSAVLVSGLGVAVGALRVFQGLPPWTGMEGAVGIAIIPLLAGLWTLRESWGDGAIARQADAQSGAQDRFQSYLEFSQLPERSPLRTLALAEAENFARTLPPISRLAKPRGLPTLGVTVLVGIALALGYSLWFVETREGHLASVELLRQAAPKIQAFVQEWPDAELQQSLAELHQPLTTLPEKISRHPRREALEAIARSEAAARSLGASFAELKQVAEALAQASETSEFRDALAAENYERAAEMARGQSAEEMQRLVERARQRKSLPALDDLAERSNPGEEISQMLQQTAREAKRNQSMEKLLAGLQDLKLQSGSDQAGSPTETAKAEGSEEATATLKAESGGEESPTLAGSAGAEGLGDKDGGGTGSDSSTDLANETARESGQGERLPSQLGPGESLQDLVLATGNDSEAKQRYRAIYQAVQSDESVAIERENLPPSSRRLVNRYLESIRP